MTTNHTQDDVKAVFLNCPFCDTEPAHDHEDCVVFCQHEFCCAFGIAMDDQKWNTRATPDQGPSSLWAVDLEQFRKDPKAIYEAYLIGEAEYSEASKAEGWNDCLDHLAPRLARQSEYVTPPEFERAFEKHHIGCLDGVSTPKTVQPDDARKALEDFDAQINALRYVLNIANSDPNKRIGTVINSTFRERDDGSMVTTLLDLENLWTNRKTIERALSQQSVPDWWKLVPIEPTPDMQGSGESSFLKAKGWASHHAVPAIYKAILSAAPQPPAAEDKS